MTMTETPVKRTKCDHVNGNRSQFHRSTKDTKLEFQQQTIFAQH